MLATLLLLHLVLAPAAGAHVLLTKADVRAAVGWIGFVALLPVGGAAMYVLFGINRVARRGARIEAERPVLEAVANPPPETPSTEVPSGARPPPMSGLEAVGRRVGGTALVEGNSVEAFTNGTGAYPPMLRAIDEAERSVALASYIFQADRVGTRFVDALARARARGVHVRVILDSIGSGLFSPAARRLERAGIPVVLFNRGVRPLSPALVNLRNHKKLLVVDGRTGFVGGLNVSADNERPGDERPDNERPGVNRHPRAIRDTHFKVEGPVVRHLATSFAADLLFASGERLEGARWWPALETRGTVAARGVSSGPDATLGAVETLFAAAVTEARERVRIVTPYFLPDQSMVAFLRIAAMRGVRVEIVVPSRSPHPLVQRAMRAQMRFQRRDGLHFHEGAAPFDHSKLVTVDGRWCAFGSPNWDTRSLRLNFEFLLECHDAALTGAVDRLIDGKIARARLLDPVGDLGQVPLPARLADAGVRLFLPYI